MQLAQLLPITQKYELRHPVTNEGLGVVLHLLGHDSSAFRTKTREILKKHQGNKALAEDLVEIENDNQGLIASCIVGWNESAEEAFGPYSPKRALELVQMPELSYMREQVEKFISERANFFRSGTEAARGDSPAANAT